MYDDVDNEFNTDNNLVRHFSEQLKKDLDPKELDLKNLDIRVVANLTHQFRMDCSDATTNWLKSLTREADVNHFPDAPEKGKYVFSECGDYNIISENDDSGKLIFEIYIVKSLDILLNYS